VVWLIALIMVLVWAVLSVLIDWHSKRSQPGAKQIPTIYPDSIGDEAEEWLSRQ
jgi:hypothetical protein